MPRRSTPASSVLACIEGQLFGARPRGVSAPPGPLCLGRSSTVARRSPKSESPAARGLAGVRGDAARLRQERATVPAKPAQRPPAPPGSTCVRPGTFRFSLSFIPGESFGPVGLDRCDETRGAAWSGARGGRGEALSSVAGSVASRGARGAGVDSRCQGNRGDERCDREAPGGWPDTHISTSKCGNGVVWAAGAATQTRSRSVAAHLLSTGRCTFRHFGRRARGRHRQVRLCPCCRRGPRSSDALEARAKMTTP